MEIRYVGVCFVALLFFLVGLSNVRPQRWNKRARVASRRRVTRTVFRRVWLMTTTPRASLAAVRERKSGRLSVNLNSGTADFIRDPER